MIDVKHGTLGAFKKNFFLRFERLVEKKSSIANIVSQPVSQSCYGIKDGFSGYFTFTQIVFQIKVFFPEVLFQFGFKHAVIENIGKANSISPRTVILRS